MSFQGTYLYRFQGKEAHTTKRQQESAIDGHERQIVESRDTYELKEEAQFRYGYE